MIYFAAFFIALNAVSFIVFGMDKYFSIKKMRRISEKRLLSVSIAGGSAGAILGQRIFRHKTQKFKGVLWVIFTVHLVLLGAVAYAMTC